MADGSEPSARTLSRPDGVFLVPGLKLAACPWCYRPAASCCLLAYDRDGRTEFEVMCEGCSAAAGQFASMRQGGLSRHHILADFGHRGQEVAYRRPAQNAAPGAATDGGGR